MCIFVVLGLVLFTLIPFTGHILLVTCNFPDSTYLPSLFHHYGQHGFGSVAMEAATTGFLFGCLGAGLIWWGGCFLSRYLAGKEKASRPNDASSPRDASAMTAYIDDVYRMLLYLRVCSVGLCLLGAKTLYYRLELWLALSLAGLRCFLQYSVYRIRIDYIIALQKLFLEKRIPSCKRKKVNGCHSL